MPIAFMAMVYYKIGRKVWASADKTRSMKLSKKHASNSKLRLTKIALAIILSFVVSWTPLNTVNVLFFFGKRSSSFSASTAHVVYPIMLPGGFLQTALLIRFSTAIWARTLERHSLYFVTEDQEVTLRIR